MHTHCVRHYLSERAINGIKKYQNSSVGFSHDIFCKKYFLIGFSWTEVRLVCASYPHRHFLASSYPWTVLASNTLVQIVMMITTTFIITTITIIIITIIIMSLSLRVIIMFLPVTGQLVWAWDGDVVIIMMVLMSPIKINSNNDDQVKYKWQNHNDGIFLRHRFPWHCPVHLRNWSERVGYCATSKDCDQYAFLWFFYDCIFVGPIGCRPYSGFSVFQLWFPPITKRHSGLPYCRGGQRVMKCGDSKMVSARWWRQDCDGEREMVRLWGGEWI